MTWEQIRMLNQMGFEIGNHTGHHAHLPGMNAAQFAEELTYIEDTGVDLGIPKPLTFAYPAYQTAPYAIEVLDQKGYLFARIGGDRPYDPETDHPYLVPSYTMLANNRDLMYEAFEQARDGNIVILTIHGVPDEAHPWVDTPTELFEEYLQYLSANDYRVLSMRDVAQFIDARQALEEFEPGF
jgi:peptidoglycan/xylan/chitin deacetylase (PgdA/CDA1 family)